MSVLATSCGQPTTDNTQIREKSEVPVSTQTPYILIVTATSIIETPSITSTPATERKKAQVVEVIDGDTIKVLINGETFSVRYIGIAQNAYIERFNPTFQLQVAHSCGWVSLTIKIEGPAI